MIACENTSIKIIKYFLKNYPFVICQKAYDGKTGYDRLNVLSRASIIRFITSNKLKVEKPNETIEK